MVGDERGASCYNVSGRHADDECCPPPTIERTSIRVCGRDYAHGAPRPCGTCVAFSPAVQHTRAAWIRGLRLYRQVAPPETALEDDAVTPLDACVHARSRFTSIEHPDRCAVYSVHEPGTDDEMPGPGDHTLVAVREFRRVPLRASTLRLVIFVARAGAEAQALAILAHYAEHALSLYQPAYLLLARSFEAPGIIALLTGVQLSTALESSARCPFSVDALLPELMPLLAAEPEVYSYDPERQAEALVSAVSPYAV